MPSLTFYGRRWHLATGTRATPSATRPRRALCSRAPRAVARWRPPLHPPSSAPLPRARAPRFCTPGRAGRSALPRALFWGVRLCVRRPSVDVVQIARAPRGWRGRGGEQRTWGSARGMRRSARGRGDVTLACASSASCRVFRDDRVCLSGDAPVRANTNGRWVAGDEIGCLEMGNNKKSRPDRG